MKIIVSARQLNGAVRAVSSKSDAHRAVICAALCDGQTMVRLGEFSDDIRATVECLSAMGAQITEYPDGFLFSGSCISGNDALLNCRESGSTLRFLLPVAAALGGRKAFNGEGRLPSRPLLPLMNELEKHNVAFDNKRLPFVCVGKLNGGAFTVPGNISSQFISGLMFALPLTGEESEIRVTDGLQSVGYVNMTLDTLARFGVNWQRDGDLYRISGDEKYVSPSEYVVEGDWSGAAFYLVAAAISGDITVKGLNVSSSQADRVILDILKKFGANIECVGDSVRVSRGAAYPISVDVSDCPDLFPILSVLACRAKGVSRLYNASRLRLKESDRIRSTADMLRAFGVSVTEREDSLEIRGNGFIEGGAVNGAGDHRIVMSAAVASLMCGSHGKGSVMVTDGEVISKSYPSFFKDFVACGGEYYAV